jgi:hypothetical protein
MMNVVTIYIIYYGRAWNWLFRSCAYMHKNMGFVSGVGKSDAKTDMFGYPFDNSNDLYY